MLNHERLDDETLAAFIDGRLTTDERAAVMRTLGADPDQYAAFMEASRIAAEARADSPMATTTTARTDVAPLPSHASNRPWRRLAYAVPLVAAAGLAAVIWMPRDATPVDVIAILQTVPTLTTAAGDGASPLPAGWTQPPWRVTRGGAHHDRSATAVRAGVRIAQLDIATAQGDTASLRAIAPALVTLLATLDGAGPASAQVQQMSARTAPQRAALARQVRVLAGADAAFDTGVWLESARIAALTSRDAFFDPNGSAHEARHQLIAALSRDAERERWLATLEQLIRLDDASVRDMVMIRAHIDSAMAAIPD